MKILLERSKLSKMKKIFLKNFFQSLEITEENKGIAEYDYS